MWRRHFTSRMHAGTLCREADERKQNMPMHNECQSQKEKPETGGRHEDDGESREKAKIRFLSRGIS